jgi:hypothetical protein
MQFGIRGRVMGSIRAGETVGAGRAGINFTRAQITGRAWHLRQIDPVGASRKSALKSRWFLASGPADLEAQSLIHRQIDACDRTGLRGASNHGPGSHAALLIAGRRGPKMFSTAMMSIL